LKTEESTKVKLIIGITAEGSVNLLTGQLNYFKELGYETYLLSPYSERVAKFCEKENCVHLPIKIEREISIFKDIITLIQIIKIFLKIRPDIINLGTPKVSLLGLFAGYLTGVRKRIYTCRGLRYEHEKGLKRQILKFTEKINGVFAQRVICISKSVLDFSLNDRLFHPEKCLIIEKGSSNGVDLEMFDPDNQKIKLDSDNILLKHSLNGKFILGFVGRLADRKGINELINVFDNLSKIYPDIRLLIVGPAEESQLRDKTILNKIENHESIVWVGRVLIEEVPAYINTMNILVLPAWWEGFGNVLIQANAMRVPVISTWATGTKDAVNHNFSGLLVQPKNENELQITIQLLIDNHELRNSLSKNAEIWAKNFSNKLIWKGLNEIYKS